jgi:hypothetical protein
MATRATRPHFELSGPIMAQRYELIVQNLRGQRDCQREIDHPIPRSEAASKE